MRYLIVFLFVATAAFAEPTQTPTPDPIDWEQDYTPAALNLIAASAPVCPGDGGGTATEMCDGIAARACHDPAVGGFVDWALADPFDIGGGGQFVLCRHVCCISMGGETGCGYIETNMCVRPPSDTLPACDPGATCCWDDPDNPCP